MSPAPRYQFKLLLLLGDLLAFAAALGAAMWIRYVWNPGALFHFTWTPWDETLRALPWALGVWVVSLRFSGVYRLGRTPVDELVRLMRAVAVTFVLLGLAGFLYRGFEYSRAVVLMMVPLTFVFTVLLRAAARFLWHQVLQLDPVQGGALVVGTGPVAQHLVRACLSPRCDFQARGIVAAAGAGASATADAAATAGATATAVPAEVEGVPVVGALSDLPRLLASGAYQAVLVADGALPREESLRIAEQCLRYKLTFHVVPDIYELLLNRVQISMVGGLPLMGLKANNLTGLNFLLKRLFDIFVSGLLLVLTAPLLLATALGIRFSSKGPLFYVQERVGMHGRTFQLIKFRSMHTGADEAQVKDYAQQWILDQAAAGKDENGNVVYKAARDPRVFAFGAFIRRFSIDELPQLINVFKGDMSLIGPRPPIPYEVEVYREWHRRRFEALPGITGLWQVSGRNRLSFDEMVKLDLEYIENWSFGLDLRIALRTIGEVISGGGL